MTTDVAEMPFLLTVEEAAELLRITPKAAYHRIARGQMPGVVRDGRRVRVLRDVLIKSLTRRVQP